MYSDVPISPSKSSNGSLLKTDCRTAGSNGQSTLGISTMTSSSLSTTGGPLQSIPNSTASSYGTCKVYIAKRHSYLGLCYVKCIQTRVYYGLLMQADKGTCMNQLTHHWGGVYQFTYVLQSILQSCTLLTQLLNLWS